jgi:hypothetical protein
MHNQKHDEQTIIRIEQENKQNRSTRPRKKRNKLYDICLADIKKSYENKSINIKLYQKAIRTISYAYIAALDKMPYVDDVE